MLGRTRVMKELMNFISQRREDGQGALGNKQVDPITYASESIEMQLFQDNSRREENNHEEVEASFDFYTLPSSSDAIPVPTSSLGHSLPHHGAPANKPSVSQANLTGHNSTKSVKHSASQTCFDTLIDEPCFSPLPSRKSIAMPSHLSCIITDVNDSSNTTGQFRRKEDNSTSLSINQKFSSQSQSQSSSCINQSSTEKLITSWPKLKHTVSSTTSSGYFSSYDNASERTKNPSPRVVNPHDYKYDAFLAYSKHDSVWAQSLSDRLEVDDFRTFLYERDCIAGRIFIKDMAKQIHNSQKVICLISSNFLSSPWCMSDLHKALFEQHSRGLLGNFLIILRIGPCDIPSEINHLKWIDCVGQNGLTDNVMDKVVQAIRDSVD
ncbi:uncharacterized protein [Amphiura filiformis]|uniref:uncharacterized protein isoform X2 n=1 Tax=Amphiura filiformis TaxID=82378 RepID=UPI003B20EF6E